MKDTQRILAVIPARKDSKGIPQKNKVVLGGLPLIFHAINKVKAISIIDDVCVTTDDEEIISYSKYLGVKAIKRIPELCEDHVPLAPVLSNAVELMEKQENKRYDIVILVQPTSPTIKELTIESSLKAMQKDKHFDTYITAVKINHLFWTINDGIYNQYHEKRVNRQHLDPIFLETGSFFIVKRDNITKDKFVGEKINIIEVSKEESLDIDEPLDLGFASEISGQKNVVFCVVGSKLSGLGHVFRGLTLSRWLSKYKIRFITTQENDIAEKIISSHNYPIDVIENWSEIGEILAENPPDLLINDILDTSKSYMNLLLDIKQKYPKLKIVNFEDLGSGASYADVVINALYETTLTSPNHNYGYKYVVVKDMFRYLPFKKIQKVKKILVTYGGTDQNSLTPKIVNLIIQELSESSRKYNITVVNGPGYSESLKKEIEKVKNSKLPNNVKITVKNYVKEMALEMFEHDLIITSNGRTVYESVSLGIPVIVFAQNEREESHLFSKFAPCVNYLGRYNDDKKDSFKESLKNLLEDEAELKSQNITASEYGKEIRDGIKRVLSLLQGDPNQ